MEDWQLFRTNTILEWEPYTYYKMGITGYLLLMTQLIVFLPQIKEFKICYEFSQITQCWKSVVLPEFKYKHNRLEKYACSVSKYLIVD